MEEQETIPLKILAPSCSSGRRECSSNSNSPEFEFWMIRNPSFPQPNLLSADELFSDGFLLPLHNLNLSNDPPPHHVPEPYSSTVVSAESSSASPRVNRWMDIFKKRSRPSTNVNADGNNGKEKRRGRNFVSPSNGFSGSELNINIWPFSRSRSAGNQGTRPPSSAAGRKVSSAPCSRSNSAGESKSRKLPSSPCRAAAGGVHLGRSSPVWQVRRRGGSGGGVSVSARKTSSAGFVGGGAKARVLSSNGGPMCVGYRHHLRCKSGDNSTHGVDAAAGGGSGGERVRGNNLFNIRSLFTKKVH